MSIISIYFEDNSELTICEALNREYMEGIYVEICKNIYKVSIYTIRRLQQEFELSIRPGLFYTYTTPWHLMIVKDMSINTIIKTIEAHIDDEYFNSITPETNVDTNKLIKIHMHEIL
jgi:hypothetical protein